jgi:hypothetical protein
MEASMTPTPDREPRGLLSTLRAFMSPAMFTAESGFAAAARVPARVLADLALAPAARTDDAASAPTPGRDGGSRSGRRRRWAGRRGVPAAVPTGRSWGRPAAREEG